MLAKPATGPLDKLRLLLLPALATCIVLPLALYGPSCGHDFGFHLGSWLDASQQMRHGDLLPRWAFTPAYNAGEPRFIFYPPLSWLLGSVLVLALPGASVPAVYTWLAISAAAWSMYRLARRYATANAATLASAVYIANPYLLFTAFERTAYAELLGAAWMPWLFGAALAETISPLAVAVPLALLWLTNAPAAVMGTYALVLIVFIRAALVWHRQGRFAAKTLLPLLGPAAGGLILGLSLAGFYLIPAAWQRRYVQISMAIIPNMRVEDNFLFGHTGYGPHDQVLHTASVVALDVVVLSLAALVFAYFQNRTKLKAKAPTPADRSRSTALLTSSVLAAFVMLMLWHFTLPLWRLLPELAFLQFPWRLLSVLGCVLGLAVGLALVRSRLTFAVTAAIALAITSSATFFAAMPFRQGCEANDLLPALMPLFQTHHGAAPTDEYTPTEADNDQLRWDDPAWWLATNANAPGPNTVPNPAATILDYDQPPPLEQTVSGPAPMHLQLHLPQPEDLILNLRDYPTWRVTVNGNSHPAHLQRDDGLLAVALPAGDDTVDVRWHTLPDMWIGDALSLVALGTAGWMHRRSRRIEA